MFVLLFTLFAIIVLPTTLIDVYLFTATLIYRAEQLALKRFPIYGADKFVILENNPHSLMHYSILLSAC